MNLLIKKKWSSFAFVWDTFVQLASHWSKLVA